MGENPKTRDRFNFPLIKIVFLVIPNEILIQINNQKKKIKKTLNNRLPGFPDESVGVGVVLEGNLLVSFVDWGTLWSHVQRTARATSQCLQQRLCQTRFPKNV